MAPKLGVTLVVNVPHSVHCRLETSKSGVITRTFPLYRHEPTNEESKMHPPPPPLTPKPKINRVDSNDFG